MRNGINVYAFLTRQRTAKCFGHFVPKKKKAHSTNRTGLQVGPFCESESKGTIYLKKKRLDVLHNIEDTDKQYTEMTLQGIKLLPD